MALLACLQNLPPCYAAQSRARTKETLWSLSLCEHASLNSSNKFDFEIAGWKLASTITEGEWG